MSTSVEKVKGLELWCQTFSLANSCDLDAIKALWDEHGNNLDVNFVSQPKLHDPLYSGLGPLHSAARNDPDAVRFLVETCGADIELRDSYGCTPLMVAARVGQLACVKVLVELGADVSASGPPGSSFVGSTAADIADKFFQHHIHDFLKSIESHVMTKSASKT